MEILIISQGFCWTAKMALSLDLYIGKAMSAALYVLNRLAVLVAST